MPAISSLVKNLANKYPDITFARGDYAHWSPSKRTVYYHPSEPHAEWIILHETAHGLLGHQDYSKDIELIRIEQQAWHYATKTLSPLFGITIDPEFIETQLDTYRDWIHTKSTCPTCQSNGIESRTGHYQCLHCGGQWRVNTGIATAIRRFVATA